MMLRIGSIVVALLFILGEGATLYAAPEPPAARGDKPEPAPRKKKVEICSGCGKPESSCSCNHQDANKEAKSTKK